MKNIAFYEPWFFLLFGIFHLHRIWGMIDRRSYADFWIGILESRNAFYYGLMIGGDGYILQEEVTSYLICLPYV